MVSSLQSVCVSELVSSKRHLIDLECSSSVRDALELMRKENVLSMPVFGRPGSWIGSGGVNLVVANKQYIGIVSVLDIVCFLFSKASTHAESSVPDIHRENLNHALQCRITDVIGSTNESLSLWVEPGDRSLLLAMEQFSKGVHRALVPEDSSCKLLSQTDVGKFISRRLEGSPVLDMSLLDLNLGLGKNSSLLSVKATTPVPVAIKMIVKEGVSAMPIVDDSGNLVATFSASDLRGVHEAVLVSIHGLTVLEYIQQTHGIANPTVVAGVSGHTLRQVLEAMLVGKIHRCWLKSEKGDHAEGVVTLTDVIATVYHEQLLL